MNPSRFTHSRTGVTERLARFAGRAGLAIAALAILSTEPAVADDSSALIALLERKGILTKDEAANVRSELAREKAAAANAKVSAADKSSGLAEKLKLSPP